MDEKILVIYCLVDDLLRAMNHYEDPQRQVSDAEVMTTAIVAVSYFGGNFSLALLLLKRPQYVPNHLSKSQFNRRLHRIDHLLVCLFHVLAHTWKELNTDLIYVIDSFPVAVCDNIRIRRSRIYDDEKHRGYIASKKRYFYGLRIHVMVTSDGKPVEVFLAPGCTADVDALKVYSFDLPAGSIIYGDKAFNDYEIEDLLKEVCGINLSPIRKKNSKRQVPGYVEYIQQYHRKIVETAGSLIERKLPKSIHAVTSKGFELKVFLFVLACSIDFLQ